MSLRKAIRYVATESHPLQCHYGKPSVTVSLRKAIRYSVATESHPLRRYGKPSVTVSLRKAIRYVATESHPLQCRYGKPSVTSLRKAIRYSVATESHPLQCRYGKPSVTVSLRKAIRYVATESHPLQCRYGKPSVTSLRKAIRYSVATESHPLRRYGKPSVTVSLRKAIRYSVNVAFITISFITQDVALIRQISLSTKQLAEAEDDKCSSRKPKHFGYILRSLIFNLYVADLNDVFSSRKNCYQYADDTTLYNHCKVEDLVTGEMSMNNTLTELSNWSQGSNLVLNPTKTKCMLFTASQMSTYHSLSSRPLQLVVEGKHSTE